MLFKNILTKTFNINTQFNINNYNIHGNNASFVIDI